MLNINKNMVSYALNRHHILIYKAPVFGIYSLYISVVWYIIIDR